MFFTHLKQSRRDDDERQEVEDSAVFVRAVSLELAGIVFVVVGQRERVRFGEQKKGSQ